MNLFKRTKGSSSSSTALRHKETNAPSAAPSTQISKSKIQYAYKNQTSPNSTKSSESASGKKKKSVLKKFKNLFRKSPKTSPSSNFPKHYLTSRGTPAGDVSNYYSNNTDGFEVILEGDRLQYEENPSKEPTSGQIKLCGTEQTCDPLVDWENFINILAGNLSGFYDLFGGDEKESSLNASRNGKQSNIGNPAKVESSELNVQSTSGANRRSLSFLQGTGVQEHAAIETTLEQGSMATSYQRDHVGNSLSSHSVNKKSHFSSSTSRGMKEEETIEIHPYNRKNDAPISEVSNTNSAKSRATANQSQPLTTHPPFQSSKDNTPEEEIYDTSFTLNFLKEVSSMGILLTYIKVPENDQPLSSEVVYLTIKPGLAQGSRLLEPNLCWTNVNDSLGEGTCVSLLGIHSIRTSLNPDDDDNPFFTITTKNGDVHAFESPTISERNHIVHGIKNVVAWLSYHLITGNMATGTELVSDLDEQRGEAMGELPSLKTPVQAMNELSHDFLS